MSTVSSVHLARRNIPITRNAATNSEGSDSYLIYIKKKHKMEKNNEHLNSNHLIFFSALENVQNKNMCTYVYE